MKSRFLRFAAGFAVALSSIAPATIPQGLMHRWSFNGNLIDSVAGGKAVIVTPATAPEPNADLTTNPGEVRLNGGLKSLSSYVSLGSQLVGGGDTPVTIELWATQRGVQSYSRIFDFWGGLTETLYMTWSQDSINSDWVGFIQNAIQAGAADTNAPYILDQEYHIVLIATPGAGVNGTERYEWYSEPSDSGAPAVRRGYFDSPYLLKALVDRNDWLGATGFDNNTADASYNEVRIYNRALSPDEILQDRAAGPDAITTARPIANADSATVPKGGQVSIDVLANDQGISLQDGTIWLVQGPQAGTVELQAGGRILYTQNGSSALTDSFKYVIQDAFGKRSAPAVVTIDISQGGRIAPALNVPADPPPLAIDIVDAFPSLIFDNALCIRSAPGDTSRLFVGERRGIISYVPDIQAAAPERRVLLDISSEISFDNTNEGEMGLLGFAFHPQFAQNHYIYVAYTGLNGNPYYDRLSRFTVTTGDDGYPVALPSSEVILINQLDEQLNHNASDVHFGPGDGYLYMSMGDEGGQMNQSENSQKIDKDLFGGVLRIDVDKKPGSSIEPNPHPAIPTDDGVARFSIPLSNPFVPVAAGGSWDGTYNGAAIPDLSKVRMELWATGLRSPWRMSFDSVAPYDLWLGDVGQDTWEEVDVIQSGNDYGWAFREGSHQTPGTPSEYIGTPPDGFSSTPPVWDYPHPDGASDPNYSGQSVTGGVVYHGSAIPSLTGAYIFADFRLGNVWALRRTSGAPDVQRIAGLSGIAAFGTDPSNGDVLMANYTQGKIKRLIQRDNIATSYPQLLSQTGIFADLTTLTPSPGLVSYQPNVAFWSDGATKSRWLALPDATSSITAFPSETNWIFLQGTIWVKHFGMETVKGDPSSLKRLETRVLVKNASGCYGVSYRWNDDGSDATLVGEPGETFDLAVTDGGATTHQTWEIPSRDNCLLCHTPVANYALGFNLRQLQRQGTIDGQDGNQIDLLRSFGYLTGDTPSAAVTPALTTADDTTTTLEYRVRSFLAANCVQCHQAGGAAPSSWDARPQLTLAETGLINGVAERGTTDPLDRLIVPGSPEHSILLMRLQASNGFTRMPPVGTHVLDQEAIDLVTQWITTELPSREFYDDWRQSYYDAGDPSGDPAAIAGGGLTNYDYYLRGESPQGSPAWQPVIELSDGPQALRYLQKAHRGYLIETSDNLTDWSLLDDPANVLHYNASDQWMEIPLQSAGPNAFYRFKISDE